MAEKQIPGGPYLVEPATSKQAQIPGWQYVVVTSASSGPGEAALSGSALTSGHGTAVPGIEIGL